MGFLNEKVAHLRRLLLNYLSSRPVSSSSTKSGKLFLPFPAQSTSAPRQILLRLGQEGDSLDNHYNLRILTYTVFLATNCEVEKTRRAGGLVLYYVYCTAAKVLWIPLSVRLPASKEVRGFQPRTVP